MSKTIDQKDLEKALNQLQERKEMIGLTGSKETPATSTRIVNPASDIPKPVKRTHCITAKCTRVIFDEETGTCIKCYTKL